MPFGGQLATLVSLLLLKFELGALIPDHILHMVTCKLGQWVLAIVKFTFDLTVGKSIVVGLQLQVLLQLITI